MRRTQSVEIAQTLDLVHREIEQWRHRQSGRTRLPRQFWTKAVALAQEYGIAQTARRLGLKYSSLKKHLHATVGDMPKSPPSRCEFVELLPGPSPAASITCTIEWEDPAGTMVRMDIKGACVADWVSFAELLRSGRP